MVDVCTYNICLFLQENKQIKTHICFPSENESPQKGKNCPFFVGLHKCKPDGGVIGTTSENLSLSLSLSLSLCLSV